MRGQVAGALALVLLLSILMVESVPVRDRENRRGNRNRQRTRPTESDRRSRTREDRRRTHGDTRRTHEDTRRTSPETTRTTSTIQTGKCSTFCLASDKLKYEVGKTYLYTYEGETDTSTTDSNAGHTGLKISAEVAVQVVDNCELALQLSRTTLSEIDTQSGRFVPSPSSSQFSQKLEAHHLVFAYHDGKVDSVCADPEDETWVVNIKRGIVSALQNSMASFTTLEDNVMETDVSGVCPTHYIVEGSSVLKHKELGSCTHRQSVNNFLFSSIPGAHENLRTLPIYEHEYECQQSTNNDIINSVTCKEEYEVSFSNLQGSRGKTTVTQRLRYKSSRQGTTITPGGRHVKTSLLFDQSERSDVSDDTDSSRQAVTSHLQDICTSNQDGVQPDTPEKFLELVSLLRGLGDEREFSGIYNEIKSNRLCRDGKKITQFLLDALPLVGTESSVKHMAGLINRNDVDEMQQDVWLTMLTLTSQPTSGMITSLRPLMEGSVSDAKRILTITSIVHRYCTSSDCSSDGTVQQMVSTLNGLLGYDCRASTLEESHKIVAALKGVGNLGNTANAAVQSLERCYKNIDLPTEVRVAAVDAYRRMLCWEHRDKFLELYQQTSEDSEVRIAAYLNVIQCPTMPDLWAIKQSLEDEDVNQVGSFVWSHLQNLRHSSNPEKSDVSNMLDSVYLHRKYDEMSGGGAQMLKYSHSHEWSGRLPSGSELHADTHFIFSNKGFLPRSVMLNLTVDVFGQPVNLFEVGGRMHGLERYLEEYFAPGSEEEVDNEISRGPRRRNKRAISDAKLNAIHDRFPGRESEEGHGSVYLRFLGNEVRYSWFSLESLGRMFADREQRRSNMLNKMSGSHNIEVVKNRELFDSTFISPTLLGIPLDLSMSASASIDLGLKAEVDLTRVFSSKELSVEATLTPSAAVQGQLTMSTKLSSFLKPGVEMVTTLHSSSIAQGKVKVERGERIQVNLDVPRDTLVTTSVKVKVYFLSSNGNKEEQKTDARQKSVTEHCEESPLGLKRCVEQEYWHNVGSEPVNEARRPNALKFTIEKNDPELKTFELEIQKSLMRVGNNHLDY